MNVVLVSQCNKNALRETRRILDQFAERIGERSWQTNGTYLGRSSPGWSAAESGEALGSTSRIPPFELHPGYSVIRLAVAEIFTARP